MPNRVAVVMTLAAMLSATSALARDDAFRNTPFRWAVLSEGSTVATTADELNLLDEWTSDGDRVLLARFGEDDYLIRDRVTLDRADELVEPIRRLGEKAREIVASRGAHRGDKLGRREWKARLRPIKEKRRELMLQVSGEIEALAREAVRRGQAQRLN
ncbi:MAG TPA: hypothetical protein VJY35_08190 [Candidatus Eisenbacteria bacterium]|nr:hypothetical protein [Candidatus Eisenbacteria bacterium]